MSDERPEPPFTYEQWEAELEQLADSEPQVAWTPVEFLHEVAERAAAEQASDGEADNERRKE